jgi:hypothetical protein
MDKIKQYTVYYCYGGRFRGDNKFDTIVEAKDKEEAEKVFKEKYHSEIIFNIIEVESKLK